MNEYIEDVDSFNFGHIESIFEIEINDHKVVYLKITKYKTLTYEYSGSWKCDALSNSIEYVPLQSASLPLITAKDLHTPGLVHVLNSKILVQPLEARRMNDIIEKTL